MSWKGQAYLEAFILPQDEVDVPGIIYGTYAALWAACKGPVCFSEFGAQDASFWEHIGAHIDAGLGVMGLLDRRQELGPSEQKVVAPFIMAYPAIWRSLDIVTGNSPRKSQILHQKTTIWNAPVQGFVPTEYVAGNTALDAIAAGVSVSWGGSFNLSNSAVYQSNTITIIASNPYADMLTAAIIEDRAWIIANELMFQPLHTAMDVISVY